MAMGDGVKLCKISPASMGLLACFLVILVVSYKPEAKFWHAASKTNPIRQSSIRHHPQHDHTQMKLTTRIASGTFYALFTIFAPYGNAMAAQEDIYTLQLDMPKSTVSSTVAAQPLADNLEAEIRSIQISPLEKELQDYEEDLEMKALMRMREPKRLLTNLKAKLSTAARRNPTSKAADLLDNASERVLTLKAYLDEAERDLFAKNWDNLGVYLYTFADQEDAFATLIEGLFPNNDPLDKSAREAMSFEAQSMFLSLDDLREAARVASPVLARSAYSKLLLSYDRFLKAGDLYPTYDPITSTAIFFANTPQSMLRFDAKAKVQVLDNVLLTEGPDMGKTGTVINIDGNNAIIKLDKDGKAYQEVKYMRLNMLSKTIDDSVPSKKKDKLNN